MPDAEMAAGAELPSCSVELESTPDLLGPLVKKKLRIAEIGLSRDLFSFFPTDLDGTCTSALAPDARSLELSCPDVTGVKTAKLALEAGGLRLTTTQGTELVGDGTRCGTLRSEARAPEPAPSTRCKPKGPRKIEVRFALVRGPRIQGMTETGETIVLVAPAIGLRRVFVEQVFAPYRCDGSVEPGQHGLFMGCMFDEGLARARVTHIGDELWIGMRRGRTPPLAPAPGPGDTGASGPSAGWLGAAEPPERIARPCGAAVHFVATSACTAGCEPRPGGASSSGP